MNTKGNRPVKLLAEFLGLDKIALCDQYRRLALPNDPDLLAKLSPEGALDAAMEVDAILSFALYCGDAQRAAHRIQLPH